MKWLIFLILVSCDCKPLKPFKRVLTEDQTYYRSELDLENRIVLDGCLESKYNSFAGCISSLPKNRKQVVYTKEGGGNSIMKTAVGTAVGYGAAKLILGK